jgi:hypothetical protein
MGVGGYRVGVCLSPALLVMSCAAALGADYQFGDVSVAVHGAASLGTTLRADNPDPQLINIGNGRALGIFANGAGRNSDDAELNWKKGQPVSTVLKGWLSLEAQLNGYGIFVRGKGWTDFTLNNQPVPWGNYPSGFQANSPLSDAGFENRAKFTGAALQEAYVFGHFNLDDRKVDVRLGNQLIPWGLPSSFGGGLSAINPVDFPALHRAGATPEETALPFPAALFSSQVTPKLALQGFWQFGQARNAYDGCGTFYGIDYRCNYVLLAPSDYEPDRQAFANQEYITRAPTPKNDELKQGGVAAKYAIEELGSEVGGYYAHYNSRNEIPQIQRTGDPSFAIPYAPGNPFGWNPQFRFNYVPNVDMFGITWQTKLASHTTLSAEYVYRPNYPLAYPPGEGLAAATTTAPSIFRPALAALAPFQWADGFDRRQTGALNLSAAQQFGKVLGANRALLTAEVGLRQVYDLPDPNVRRYLRPDGFGSGPVDGACGAETPGVKYTGCTYRGFVTENAWSYRLRGSLTYDVSKIPDLSVTLLGSFGQDVSGWSWDGSFTAGRYVASVGVRANMKSFYAEVIYAPTWGGDFNIFRDRSVVMASMGAKF